jgi:hypothetical protein
VLEWFGGIKRFIKTHDEMIDTYADKKCFLENAADDE